MQVLALFLGQFTFIMLTAVVMNPVYSTVHTQVNATVHPLLMLVWHVLVRIVV